ncbi:MAG: hypothetical protein CUN55_07630 [Phototrophicales bacterium]|nr:MAG: hypothetical protein CUN55_07630 [Phototrophicales bacterium]
MLYGENQPSMTAREPALTIKSIRDVLKRLGQFDQLPETPLAEYVLVRQYINRPESVKDNTAIARIVFDVVANVITEEFTRLRQKLKLPAPTTEQTNEDHLNAIKLDAQSDNPLLMAASSVYYVYLTPELHLDFETVDRLFHVDSRTMQRWRNQFFERVRQKIIKQEVEARQNYRKKKCLFALPHTPITFLESQEQTIRSALNQFQHTKAIMIYGPSGSGKSVVAEQLAKRCIEILPISDIVWLRLPQELSDNPTSDDLLRLICDELYINYAKLSPRHALQSYLAALSNDEQLLLILDNASEWMRALLDSWIILGQCWLIVTANARLPEWPTSEIGCQPISLTEAKQLLKFLQRHFYPTPNTDDLASLSETLHETYHGNIGHIQHAYRFIEHLTPTVHFQHQLPLTRLSDQQQRLLLLMGYLALNTTLIYDTISRVVQEIGLCPQEQLERDFLALIDSGFLQAEYHPPERYYHLAMSLEQLLSNDLFATNNTQLIECIIKKSHQPMGFHLLCCSLTWTQLSSEQLLKIVRLAHYYVKQKNMWQQWLMRLQSLEKNLTSYPTSYIILLIEKAAALRWLGRFQDAQQTVNKAIALAHPFPLLLAEGLLERSRLAPYIGTLDDTDAQWAGEIFTEHGNQEGIQRALLSLARLWCYSDPETAENFLLQVTEHDTVYWSLYAEIKLAQGHIKEAREMIRHCLQQANHQEASYARLLNLLGRILSADGQTDAIYPVYENAINYAQQYYDIWGLARLYTNFAAILINFGDLSTAREQLLRAIQLYKQIQDSTGQQAAQDNLNLLRKLAKDS